MKTALLVLAGLLVVLAVAFVGFGRERSWAVLFGPADLGEVNFAELRPANPDNSFLACDPAVCPRAVPDLVPPVFAADPQRLRLELARIIAADGLVEQVAEDSDGLGARYVQRTPWMRFPDTIQIRYVPVDVERTTLAIYSRSQIGSNDFGVNEARVRRWLAALARAVSPVAAA